MIKGANVLAVIPARGGSKRCPRKNVRDFLGTPLIQWAYQSARSSKYIDKVVLSSEDDEILGLAKMLKMYDIEKRPAELATDTATCEDVLRYHLKQYPHDWVVLLQPTSPLRKADDIDACIERAQLGWGCITYNEDTHQKNGAVYVAHADWLAQHEFTHAGLTKLDMPAERSLDIDYAEQFQ